MEHRAVAEPKWARRLGYAPRRAGIAFNARIRFAYRETASTLAAA